VVAKKTHQIICIEVEKGRRHDYHLYKNSKVHIHPQTQAVVDTGYQGLQKIHSNTLKPLKSSKKKPLTKEDKKSNHQISSVRVAVEHVIRSIKIFRIMAERYRNRRKRFTLRLSIICSIFNLEL